MAYSIFNKYTVQFIIAVFVAETITTLAIVAIFLPTKEQFVNFYYLPDLIISLSAALITSCIIHKDELSRLFLKR